METIDGMHDKLLLEYPSIHKAIYNDQDVNILSSPPSPHNQSLERRIGDYLNDNYPQDEIPVTSPLETTFFRDLNPAFVVTIHPGNVIILEPGNVGPLNPLLSKELLYCINNCIITIELYNSLWSEHGLLYEGGLIIGIVDYRLSNHGISTRGIEREMTFSSMGGKRESLPSPPSMIIERSNVEGMATNSITNIGNNTINSNNGMNFMGMGGSIFPPSHSSPTFSFPTPNEMHKIWLKPCQQVIIQEMRIKSKNIKEALELEKKYLEWSNSHLITSSNPLIFPLKNLVYFNCHSMNWIHSEIFIQNKEEMERERESEYGHECGISNLKKRLELSREKEKEINNPILSKSKISLSGDGMETVDPSSFNNQSFSFPFTVDISRANMIFSNLKNKRKREMQLASTDKRISNFIQELRIKKLRQESEPFHGLDAKKDPIKAKLSGVELNFNWIMSRLLWRTIRYERDASLHLNSQSQSTLAISSLEGFHNNNDNYSNFHDYHHKTRHGLNNHYTIHIFYHPISSNSMQSSGGMGGSGGGTLISSPFEILMRWGSVPCTAINGDTLIKWMSSKATVEHFLESFRLLMNLEGISCISDVSNPVVLTMGIVNSMHSSSIPSMTTMANSSNSNSNSSGIIGKNAKKR